MDYLFWNVKGYAGIELTKEELDNKKYSFDEIKQEDSSIVKQIEDNLSKGGIVLGLCKKKTIKAIYFFKLETKDKEKILVFDRKIVLNEVNKCVKEFENDINTVLNKVLFERYDIDKTIWKEREVSRKENFKSSITGTKVLVWVGIIICTLISLSLIVNSSIYSLEISNYTNEEIKKDELLIDYIAKLNHYDYYEVINLPEIEDKITFTVIEIILPTAIILLGYIFLIIALKEILDLLKNIIDNKTLFTNEKYKQLNKIILIIDVALLIMLDNFILWLAMGALFEMIKYIIKYCIYFTNVKK